MRRVVSKLPPGSLSRPARLLSDFFQRSVIANIPTGVS